MMFHRLAMAAFILVFSSACLPAPTLAQSPPSTATTGAGTITGTVTDSAGHPVAGAQIRLSGGTPLQAVSASDGAFRIAGVPAGVYSLWVTKSGFATAPAADITVVDGQDSAVTASLQEATFSSIGVIGRVGTRTAANSINVSPATINTITQQAIVDQGDPQVKTLLSQIPGVQLSNPGAAAAKGDNGAYGSNGATMAAPALIQIRGALEYETASLIDGHPIALGRSGAFDASYLNSYLLQTIEVVKGPGAIVPNINYAVGGTVNYRTLEPTAKRLFSVDLGYDRYGGSLSNFRATGTIGKLGYAIDYALNGTPGPFNNYSGFYSFGAYGAINGVPIDTARTQQCMYGGPPPGLQSALIYKCDTVVTGYPINTQFFQRAGLAKLRYNISNAVTLTTAYISSNENYAAQGTTSFYLPYFTFVPPAGYTGPLFNTGHTPCCNNARNIETTTNTQGLFESELRTAVSPNDTFLARYYQAGTRNNLSNPSALSQNVQLFGGPIYLSGQVAPNVYNGQTVTLSSTGTFYGILDVNRQNGYTFEFDHSFGGTNTLTASYDYAKNSTYSYLSFSTAAANVGIVPDGSNQTFSTIMLRDNFQLGPKLSGVIGGYLISYTNRYSPNGSTFTSNTTSTQVPRLGLTYRPDNDTAVRFSAGGSIAPPYILLVGNPSGPPSPNRLPVPTSYSQTVNSGNVLPETAFAYDLGADKRFGSDLIVSGDVYLTNLHNQFLSSQSVSTPATIGGVPNTGNLPLYTTSTGNLGQSRYAGVELSVRKVPVTGLGFIAQGAMIRAYAYNLPANIYLANGSTAPVTNLGVTPYTNFSSTGEGFNGISAGRVPYADGYAELNYRTRKGLYASAGYTYYGNNNAYNQPPFWILHATLRYDITKRDSLQISADNLTNQYGTPDYNIYGGIPVPLANGLLGTTPGNNYGPTTARIIYHHTF